ncbi:DUF805 domain-containing protein [Seleniivibrio woodruffii]|uniref:Uncharacterized membrane protein YhaH (DUF805 family) n=1 Tax=Seleniivibrio woodruffii TaxID=1078050 RepID=A0A4R1KCH7_9BACT|nr:DUF805 domain-containing protein [Seleniivibrio woodruffii]TCK62298.1 uncharacterized membrane protein YhaH (DUF805 family) [Seleniivibrio woodruffii]TVZ34585.1 uncharacterized membrane protein YhaH (DUF805 family) [Seleniivibrio woodruffii]
MQWYLKAWKNWSDFKGRATRTEYWMFTLFNFAAYAVLGFLDFFAGLSLLDALYSLAVLIPLLAVTVRRLHDTDRSGFWIFILLVPFIGLIVLIVFLAQESRTDNRYGTNPKKTAEY